MSLVEFGSGLARRYLSVRHVETIRSAYLGARQRLAPLLTLAHGSFDAGALRMHLERRLDRPFEVLMVHSSVNAMKPMFRGTALDLVRMLIDWCGPTRTLAMPAFFFGEDGEGAYRTFQRNPRFDLTRTPSQMGLATELFRRLPGVVQSRHPVYRIAAIGPLAVPMLSGHEHASSPAGRGSPFEYMAAHDTLILGIGKPVQVMTQAHHTEEIMGDEFPVPSHVNGSLAMTLVERGREMPFTLRSRSVDGRFDIWRVRALLAPGTLAEWTWKGVPFFAARAADVTTQLVAAARAGHTLYER
jgi:aminoglycoside 3-N-acetyltransferase